MITIEHKKYNKIEEINVKGHAGYAPIGKDIICSAVSSVVYTLKIASDGSRITLLFFWNNKNSK